MATDRYTLTLGSLTVRELAMIRDALTAQRMACRAAFTSDDAEAKYAASIDKMNVDSVIHSFRIALLEQHPEAFRQLYDVTNVRVIDDGVNVPHVVSKTS